MQAGCWPSPSATSNLFVGVIRPTDRPGLLDDACSGVDEQPDPADRRRSKFYFNKVTWPKSSLRSWL